ncbi:hypothetical protein IHC39_002742 [Enterococcus faecalis]|uniref:hypothetical protein n=1 Tax=Enterococcus TaxID=1350 RepID=UPI00032EC91D|nr:hypothetical protein [Enterococcus faecalis]EGO2586812.1 hypothetical protein [Enterococcus faecalis]EGO2588139.1 hypothetical protein [Enterococcus faecalis]EGO5850444.1 hypothetical protein [Enterococcus faecalis]EGO5851897.1 hypothetical protein [Enterococcus faecalis]EJI7260787.1 hypothetical protein [Enterococcus faecalis]
MLEQKDILDIILKLVGTSVPGYVAYLTLYKLNMISINRQRSDENKVILAILSGINCFLGLSILQTFESNQILGNPIIVSILILIISVLIYPKVFPLTSEYYQKYINKFRRKQEFGEVRQLSRYKQVFDKSGKLRIAIFDFNGTCIINGRVASMPEDIEFDYFDIVFTSIIENPSDWSEAEIIDLYKENEKKGAGTYSVYIDIEKKIKIHVFHQLA